MIERLLTPYQRQQHTSYIRDWRMLALSTERANREVAEAAITKLRGYQGQEMRFEFKWVDSPPVALKQITKRLKKRTTGRQRPLIERTREILDSWLNPAVYSSITDGVLGTLTGMQINAYVRKWMSAVDADDVKELGDDGFLKVMEFPGVGSLDRICQRYNYGQFSASEVAFLTFQRDVMHSKIVSERHHNYIAALADIVRSTGIYWNFEHCVIACERPSVLKFNDRGQFHATDGPAFAYPDGTAVYTIHGVGIPAHFIEDPESLKPSDIDQQRNIEVRRVLMDLFGTEKYLRQTGAVVIHNGRNGRKLWWRLGQEDDNEPIVMVEVINSTPESNGEFKHYFIRVPPSIKDADEAIAWTFKMTKEDYFPLKET